MQMNIQSLDRRKGPFLNHKSNQKSKEKTVDNSCYIKIFKFVKVVKFVKNLKSK